MGRRALEYERIRGIKKGNNQYTKDSANGTKLTQEELADQLNISVDTLKRAKKLASAPQEVQDAVETGRISASTASRVIAALPEDQQVEVVLGFPATTQIIG